MVRFVDSRCTCTTAGRCDICTQRQHAHLRMYSLVVLERSDRHRQPVAYADQVTSMNDARTALCLAMGRTVDEIHPCTGHDMRGVR